MTQRIQSMVLCMKRDRHILNKLISNIGSSEPCSVVGYKDNGKEIIYLTLVEIMRKRKSPYILKAIQISEEEELRSYLLELEQEEQPVLSIIHLMIEKDVSFLFDALDKLRFKRHSKFVSIVFSYIESCSVGLAKKNKSLVGDMLILKPVDFNDTKILLHDFEKRFRYRLFKEQTINIYQWAAGHCGLVKSLYLAVRNNPNFKFSLENILKEENIKYRLKAIVSELSKERINALLNTNRKSKENEFFEKFGYINNSGNIFSPLIIPFVKQEDRFSSRRYFNLLTITELAIFQYLKENSEEIVGREEVARILWKDQWEDKYSEWAIDQIIHRIREKLRLIKAPYKITTKKGKGFILLQK